MKVALYARVSSESQEARGTIVSQVEALRDRMVELDHEIVAEYLDDGHSGARLDRPGLDALRDAVEAGTFEEVWCLTPDRLARNYAYQALILDELARFGVKVRFLDALAINDDPQAKLLVQMQGVIAEYERTKIMERNRRGKLYHARAGEIVFWKAPYGYRRLPRSKDAPARFEIYEPEAQVVRRIFDEYVSGGQSVRKISWTLYNDGILPPSGRQAWNLGTLSMMLRNPTYKGKARYNYSELEHRPGRRPRQRPRPPEQWIEVPVPAIVSEDVFEQAQQVSHRHSELSPRRSAPGKWLLRRLVVCGHCGVRTNCKRTPNKSGGENFYYRCYRHDLIRAGGPERQCTQPSVRADELDAFVWEHVRDALLHPDLLLAGEQAVLDKEPLPDDELLRRQLERLARQLDQVELERRRLIDAYQVGIVGLSDLQHRGIDLETRQHQLQSERDRLAMERRQLSVDNRLRQRVTAFAERVRQGIDSLNFEQRQHLLRLLIEEVRITGWQVQIRLRIPLDRSENRSPEPGKDRAPPPNTPVSSEVRLRSIGRG